MKISSWANVIFNDDLWMVHANQNGLFRLDLLEMKAEYVTQILKMIRIRKWVNVTYGGIL